MSRDFEIRYLSTAQQDLLEIFEYIQRDNPRAAAELLEQIDSAIGRLAQHPNMGSIPKEVAPHLTVE